MYRLLVFLFTAIMLSGCANVNEASDYLTCADPNETISATHGVEEDFYFESFDGFEFVINGDCIELWDVSENDMYWEWQIEGLSDEAEVYSLDASEMHAVIIDGGKLYLIHGRSEPKLLTESGVCFHYLYEGFMRNEFRVGCLCIEEGSLYFVRISPAPAEGKAIKPVLLAEGVQEVVTKNIFIKDGRYWLLPDRSDDGYVEPVEIGESSSFLERDVERLRDYKMTLEDFEKKYLPAGR